jgi:hypothetical protein
MPEQEAFNPEQFSKLVADTPALIRKPDVYRLLDECAEFDRPTLSDWLTAQRPDLAEEVRQVLTEL